MLVIHLSSSTGQRQPMKKPYCKPTLARRGRLSAVTAAVPSSGFSF
jgi:hypothetical protein